VIGRFGAFFVMVAAACGGKAVIDGGAGGSDAGAGGSGAGAGGSGAGGGSAPVAGGGPQCGCSSPVTPDDGQFCDRVCNGDFTDWIDRCGIVVYQVDCARACSGCTCRNYPNGSAYCGP
jgi:hypothetical protein